MSRKQKRERLKKQTLRRQKPKPLRPIRLKRNNVIGQASFGAPDITGRCPSKASRETRLSSCRSNRLKRWLVKGDQKACVQTNRKVDSRKASNSQGSIRANCRLHDGLNSCLKRL